MLKQFNDTAKALFVAKLLERFPEYKHKKSLRAFLAGGAELEMNIDADHSAWIAFGGFKEDAFAVFAGWTVSGKNPKELLEWGQQANPNAFTPPPVPPDAWVDLRDRWRFEPSPGRRVVWHRHSRSSAFVSRAGLRRVNRDRIVRESPPKQHSWRASHLQAEHAVTRRNS